MATKKMKFKSETEELVMFVVGLVDYDIYKSYDPRTAEEPEYAAEELASIVNQVESKFAIAKRRKV